MKVCECGCECLTGPSTTATTTTAPLFYDFFPSRTSLSPARGQPFALPSFLFRSCDLITPLLISFDRRQLIRGQHLDGPHGNRQDQIFWSLKGGLGSGWWRRGLWKDWGGAVRNSVRLTAMMDGAEQRPLNDVTLAGLSTVCVRVCVCVR